MSLTRSYTIKDPFFSTLCKIRILLEIRTENLKVFSYWVVSFQSFFFVIYSINLSLNLERSHLRRCFETKKNVLWSFGSYELVLNFNVTLTDETVSMTLVFARNNLLSGETYVHLNRFLVIIEFWISYSLLCMAFRCGQNIQIAKCYSKSKILVEIYKIWCENYIL